jgi:hypothetical protein
MVDHCLGRKIIDKKSETGRPSALDGQCLIGGHNNQPRVGVDGGSGILEERPPWSMVERVGGCHLFAWSGELTKENITTKMYCGLRWPPTIENHN